MEATILRSIDESQTKWKCIGRLWENNAQRRRISMIRAKDNEVKNRIARYKLNKTRQKKKINMFKRGRFGVFEAENVKSQKNVSIHWKFQ